MRGYPTCPAWHLSPMSRAHPPSPRRALAKLFGPLAPGVRPVLCGRDLPILARRTTHAVNNVEPLLSRHKTDFLWGHRLHAPDGRGPKDAVILLEDGRTQTKRSPTSEELETLAGPEDGVQGPSRPVVNAKGVRLFPRDPLHTQGVNGAAPHRPPKSQELGGGTICTRRPAQLETMLRRDGVGEVELGPHSTPSRRLQHAMDSRLAQSQLQNLRV